MIEYGRVGTKSNSSYLWVVELCENFHFLYNIFIMIIYYQIKIYLFLKETKPVSSLKVVFSFSPWVSYGCGVMDIVYWVPLPLLKETLW